MFKIIQKAKNSPLSSDDLNCLVNNQTNFLGIFASDQLETLRIVRPFVFFIVNLDISTQIGSHWIAIRIGRRSVEIFDSLGFSFDLWQVYPKYLLRFLSRYTKSHNFLISPVLQPPNTYTCGLYTVFFIIYRQRTTFRNCISKFSRNLFVNNLILFSFMNRLIK